MLKMLASGERRLSVCDTMGMSYHTFKNLMAEHPHFGRWVREAEARRAEACEAHLFRLATRGFESPVVLRALLAYLGRCDRVKEARRKRREQAQD